MPSQTPKFGNLLEAVPDALVGVDKSGVIRLVNRQTEALFGYERADLIGSDLERLVPESLREIHAAHRAAYNANPRTRPMGTDLRLVGRHRDGTQFPIDVALSPVITGGRLLVIAAVRDMTRYREAEATRRRLDRLSAVVEFSGEAITSGTLDGIITSWNPAAERLYGYTGEEIIGEPSSSLVPPDRADELGAILDKVRAGRAVENLETVRVRKDGTVFPALLTFSPLRDADGTIVGASVISRDATAQRKAFEAAQLMEAVIEYSGEAIITSTLDGVITSWNPAAERLFGYSRKEMIGQSGRRLSPENRTEEIRRILARIGAGESVEPLETVRIRKDGTRFPIVLTVSPIRDKGGAIVGASSITRDMTEHEQAMRSAQRMATLVEQSESAIISSTLEGVITTWNPAAERLYGYTCEEIVGKSIQPVTPEDRAEEIKEILTKVRAGQSVEHLETVRVRKDGTTFPALITVSPIRGAGGDVVGASVISQDVTKQREATQTAKRLAAIVEQSDDAITSTALDGTVTTWNPAAERLFGYSSDEIVGRSVAILTPPGYDEGAPDLRAMIAAGQSVARVETERLRKDGTMVPVAATFSPIRDAGGVIIGASAVARDITDQKRTFESARSMIEASLDAFVAISPGGLITDANEATVKATGVPRDQLIGTPFSAYFTDPGKAEEIYQQVLSKGMAVDFPLTLRRRDGQETLTEVLYNASAYRDSRGTVLGVFAVARDVTQQKQAALYARSLIEAALDPLVTISPQGQITDVNEATVKATGVPRDDIIGTGFSQYFTEPDRAEEGYQEVLEKGSVTDYQLTLRHRDGSLTEVLYNASLYRDTSGKVLGVFAAARDVSRQVQAQRDKAEQQARELERLAELERFQRLTVGRELKMIEMKKELEYLRKHGTADGGGTDDQP